MVKRLVIAMSKAPARAYAAAVLIVSAAVVTALAGVWLFDDSSNQGSVWGLIVADRWALGFLRLAIVAGGAYVAASVAALIANGRWIKALSTTGVEVDAHSAEERIEKLELRAEGFKRERDLAYRLLEDHLHG